MPPASDATVTCGFLEVRTLTHLACRLAFLPTALVFLSHASRLYAEQRAFHPEVRCQGGSGGGQGGSRDRDAAQALSASRLRCEVKIQRPEPQIGIWGKETGMFSDTHTHVLLVPLTSLLRPRLTPGRASARER